MNTKCEEAIYDCRKQRRKSIGACNIKNYSIGITTSPKSIRNEGNNNNNDNNNNVPNYLRASTGSCHDFCKYGKKHQHSKSAVPVKLKATTFVNKDRFTKPLVTLERNKAKTTLKPFISPESVTKKNGNEIKTCQQSGSVAKMRQGTNGGIKRVDIKTVKKTSVMPKTDGVKVKKVISNPTLNESKSPKASFSRAANLATVEYKGVKHVSPLKDQNRMPKTKPKQKTDDNVQTKILQCVEDEAEVKPEIMEFESIQSSMEPISDLIRNSSESFSGGNVESIEFLLDKELLAESLTAPAVVESLQSCSDKEVLEGESLIVPTLSENSEFFYDDEVLEVESEYTDDDDDDEDVDVEDNDEEVDVLEGSETTNVNEMETSVGNQNKIPRKSRVVISEDKDEKAVKLRFRRGKIIDLKSEDNGPKRLKFRRRVTEGNKDGQSIAARTYKNKTLVLQADINGPRKLKFAKGRVMEGSEDKQRVSRRSFEKKCVEENKDSNNGPESVVLKHQGEQGKKDAQGLLNNVIEETASKLVESRKSKVKALVGAFETVISLQDGKPPSS